MSRRSRRLTSRIASLNPFSRPVDRAMDFKRSRKLACEPLEERRLLATLDNNLGITIDDATVATPYPSTIVYGSQVQAEVLDANIRLRGLTHTFPDDIQILIEGPGGNALLMADAGNGNAVAGVDLTFDDAAGAALPDAGQIVSGTFTPTDFGGLGDLPAPAPLTDGTLLSVFNGTSPVGDWNLYVNDDTVVDVGSISGWSVDLVLGGAVTIDAGADANDGSGDTFVVTRSGDNLLVTVNGNTVFDEPFAGITSLTIDGSDDNDSLLVDLSNGDAIPNVIDFVGAGGSINTLDVDDSATTAPTDYLVTNTQITRVGFGDVIYDGNTTLVNLDTGTDNDSIDVNSTSLNASTIIRSHEGDDLYMVDASNLGGSNIFFGNSADDKFEVEVTSAAEVSAPLVIHGDDNGTGNRDEVEITDIFGIGAANVTVTYTGAAGGSGVTVDGLINQISIDTVETIGYAGSIGNDDSVNVVGTTGDDLITAAPISPTRALVFNNDPNDSSGPFDGPPQDFATRIPGVSGGSIRPDLDLSGIASQTGLNISDTGTTTGDRLYVYGESAVGVNDGNAFDPFGFGAGQIIPAVAEPASFDTITVTDTSTAVDGLAVVNYNATDFQQADPIVDAAVVINSGFEGSPATTPGTDTADDITVVASTNYKFQVNGGDPEPPSVTPPDGDALTILGPEIPFDVVNVWSLKDPAGIPSITVDFAFATSGLLPIEFSSIENLNPIATKTLNIIGDDNDPAVDQNDDFRVVGTDFREFDLYMNNVDVPLRFESVEFLNVFGDDQNPPPGTPSAGNDIDTLEITPYADNTPQGWGIDVFFNEGNPAGTDGVQDLLIYHTSLGGGGGGSVSEDIVIQPSGIDSGELRVTNQAFGTPVVAISYTANTDIIIIDDDGSPSDSDTLTLAGSSPTTPGLSGSDRFDVDFDAVGDVLNPLVTVTDTVGAGSIYRVRNITGIDTVTFDLQAGNDIVTFATPDTGIFTSGVDQANIIGGGGDDTVFVSVDGRNVWTGGRLNFDGGTGADRLQLSGTPDSPVNQVNYNVGPNAGDGSLDHIAFAGTQTIDFQNLEPVIDSVVAAGLVVFGDGAANTMTYTPGSVLSRGLVSIDGFETIEFENKTVLTLNAGSGDDTIVAFNPNVPTGLQSINLFGVAGNDDIRIESLPDASSTTFLSATASGGAGNDTVDASLITVQTPLNLSGEAGNDLIIGGNGSGVVDTLLGGDDNDTIIGNAGNNSIDGGDGVDTQLIQGTDLADVIDVLQSSAVTLDSIVNGDLRNDTINSIEKIRIELLDGDDTARATHADALVATPDDSIPMTIVGAAPNASDILVVRDDGLGDTVVQRLGADDRSGSVTVGPLAPIDYESMETVFVLPLNPITGGTGTDELGELVVFKHDEYESNNSLQNATFLGAGPTINVDPVIDPGPGLFGIPGDSDFYQFVAQETGTLDFQLYFEPVGTLANGRAGLPGDGELSATFYDNDGLPVSIGSSTALNILDGSGNKIGERITIPVVRNETYFVQIQGENGGINTYNFTAITTAAPIPELVDLQAASDTGRNDTDDVTKDTTPTFTILLDDDRIDEFMNLDLAPDTTDDNLPTVGFDYGVEVFNNVESIGFAFYTGVGNQWEFTAQDGDLNEGDFNHISAAVWIRDAADPAQIGRHSLSDSLQITLDTITPDVYFGLPNSVDGEDGLLASSDTGVLVEPLTFSDRITSDTTPALWGRAEANTVVRVYHDNNADGVINLDTDTFLGQTVAVPLDGNNAFLDGNGDPLGFWFIESVLDLNEIPNLRDGVRRLLVTAEDVAGNPMPMNDQIDDNQDELQIFIDTQGPQVTAVYPTDEPTFDLFDPKPSENGFTPLIDSITVDVQDLPFRLDQAGVINDFLYEALVEEIAEEVGNYSLVGDHVGIIGIVDVEVTNIMPIVGGQPAFATIEITFDQFLPDDRYTFTISDNLVDPANDNLDGESNASAPLEDPDLPSGDGIPGGDFVGRFTIDSRPEIGTFIPTTIAIDINGNFVWDPSNAQIGNDRTNVDLTFTMDVDTQTVGAQLLNGQAIGGFATHDNVFAGKFTQQNEQERLFDQLGVYGYSIETGEFRWLMDFDSDGVSDLYTSQPSLANFNVQGALPIAGNFDGVAGNGDEVGLYYAGDWAFDFNGNYIIEPGEVVANTGLLGAPIIGDFDGNGVDDVGVFSNNFFNFAFSFGNFGNFGATAQLQWGFPGVLERPVAADMNQDGIDDIGLWVPRNSTQPLRQTAEWYFLLSDPDTPNVGNGPLAQFQEAFEPVPFGNDIYAEFGDELALPIVGNFDPPVAAQTTPPIEDNTIELLGDYDGSGTVDQGDYTVWKSTYGATGTDLAADGNNDGVVDLADYSVWRSNRGATMASIIDVSGDYDGSGTVDQGDYDTWSSTVGQTGSNLDSDGNNDNVVDLADYVIWRQNIGASGSSSQSQSATTETATAASSDSALSFLISSDEPSDEASNEIQSALSDPQLVEDVFAIAEDEDDTEIFSLIESDEAESEDQQSSLDEALLEILG